MSRLWPQGEPILIELNTQGQPTRFTWRGQMHRTVRILQQWEVQVEGEQEGSVRRAYLALTTTDGLLCVIYRDLIVQSWFLAKVYD